MNWMVIPTLAGAFLLFAIGSWLWGRLQTNSARVLLLVIAVILAVPGILYTVYYLHLFDDADWFYQLRSLPFTELLAAGAGLLAGMLATIIQQRKVVTRPFIIAMLTLGISVPYLKPIVAPVRSGNFEDRWADGVCLQSTSSSCGPASAATLLRASGNDLTEAEIAGRCFTYLGGTENWYLARFLRQQGYRVRFITRRNPAGPLPVPSIAGVKVGGMGHFIPIMEETVTTYITGDPLVGRREWPKDKIRERMNFTGFFMEVRRTTPRSPR